MATGELLIKINGDVKNYEDALKQAQQKTEALSASLKTVSTVAAVGFAALTAEVFLSVKAFDQSEKATNKLSQALQNQGIYSKSLMENYQEQAKRLQDLTGIEDEAILNAQAIVQAQLGQIAVTDKLTRAIADLAAGQNISLEAAAELIAKGINGQTRALKMNGIEINDNLSKQDRVTQIIEKVNGKYKDYALAVDEGTLASMKFNAQFSEMQKSIGKNFAPIINTITNALANLFKYLSDPAMAKFISGLIAAGVTFTGLIATVGGALTAFLAFKAVVIAAGTTMAALSAPVLITVGAIAALAVGVGLLVANWESIWPRMQASFAAFAEFMSDALGGLGKLLSGVFTFKFDMIKEGLAELKDALSQSLDEYNDVLTEKLDERAKIEKEADDKKVTASKASLEAQKTDLTTFYGWVKWANSQDVKDKEASLSKVAAMQSSSNDAIKTIGKAGALAQIAIDTPKNANAALGAFAFIPLIGPALGYAAAAAAIAFGAEQASKVISAADGGLMTGGTPGVDSIHTMTMPGELVVPTRNFDEVVGAVSNKRSGGNGGMAEIVISLKDDLMDFIEAKLVERQNLNLSIQGS